MTDIKLISSSHDLYLLCRGILSEITAQEWTLRQSEEYKADSSVDLYIWDYQPDMRFPEAVDMRRSDRHLFLVQRAHLCGFRQIIGDTTATIIRLYFVLSTCPSKTKGLVIPGLTSSAVP